jgi:hypothetical protein
LYTDTEDADPEQVFVAVSVSASEEVKTLATTATRAEEHDPETAET